MAKKKKKKRSYKRRKKDKRAMELKLKKETVYSVVQITFFSLAALILISFSRKGLLLIKLNDLLFVNFGWVVLLLPFVFISFAFLVSNSKIFLSQPNVVIGSVLLFVSLVSFLRSGKLGKSAWEGMSTLITSAGSFIILLGTTVASLIILFNTSLDHVASIVMNAVKRYVFGEGKLKKAIDFPKRSKMKVLEGGSLAKEKTVEIKVNEPDTVSKKTEKKQKEEDLQQKLVSNVKGEDTVWKYPPSSLLSDDHGGKADRGDIKGNAAIIEQTLESFGITARVVEVNLGPAVTQYAIEVALGTKLSKITSLERDLALALAAPTGTIRIEAPIPGRSLVGIELPNKSAEFVTLKRIMESETMDSNKSKLAVSLGLDVSGKPVVTNLAKMPHMLIAGQTGSGKSVCINSFLSTILFRAAPSEVKLILVDPKRVELTGYNGIPHLLTPVIVDPKEVLSALRWVQSEMDRRYKLFAQAGARNIDSFNEMSGFQALPYIVVFVDELADIMLFSPVEVEDTITRIAQMSRATGIHMVLATQRPSVDVITGLIKANIPCRVAFAVASQVDSRVILDGQGAEKLLGRGDMLYLPPEQAKPMRIQGAYVSDKEINSLVSFLKNQGVEPQYTEEVTEMPKPGTTTIAGVDEDLDELFEDAVRVVIRYDRASASLLQRRMSVGYARAARILDQLEAAKVVGPADGSKPRDVLVQNAEEVLSSTKTT
ncbi:DNA translocase FtsK [Candidatus Woesebacteria bacterium]|nr:DNA translocase FtsK [Candidatus Woesebacteria bacterium]